MIEYEFYLNEIGTPQFGIKGNLEGLGELGGFDLISIIKIVKDIEDILTGTYDKYDFGYEVYMIKCQKNESIIMNTFED
ncbi:MAG: hypothetical protein LBU62_11045, partial [Bacteroidales bacterium]|nr:hypothetical protein [Bacteroidales bacterium]